MATFLSWSRETCYARQSAVKLRTSGSSSSRLTVSTIALTFCAGHFANRAQSSKLGNFGVAHGIGGAALGEILTASKGAAVFELNGNNAGHLVVAGSLGLRMHSEVDPLDHCPNLSAPHHFIVNFSNCTRDWWPGPKPR